MRRSRVFWFVCLVVVLALSPAWALAGGEKKTEGDKKTEEAREAGSDKPSEKKSDEKPELPAVITNETLKRFRDSPPPAPSEPVAKPGPAPKLADPKAAKPAAPQDAESEMSPAERAKRIAEIDAELERLDRRLLALKNPLLRGTVPPTEEEKQEERGMNNIEILQATEKRIAELKAEKQELKSP